MQNPSTLVHSSVAELREYIEAFTRNVSQLSPRRYSGICGFDGFIDTFIRIQRPATMADFGAKVQAAAGISASYPVHHLGDTFGGNGPLLATALHQIYRTEIDITYVGALGRPSILPIFEAALGNRMRALYSLAEPAHSDCLEFNDGKIMLSDLRSCAEIDWPRLVETVGLSKLDTLLRPADFVAAVNWGKLENVESIWAAIPARLSELKIEPKKVIFFMDLAEFEHRPESHRARLLDTLKPITAQCRTILSFNLKEAWQMAELTGGAFHGKKAPDQVAELAHFLRRTIAVDQVIVHPNNGAACAGPDRTVYLPGPYCQEPLISTGAGDNFGAGVLAAALAGLDDYGMLLAGSCASGHFVRSGHSATWDQIAHLAHLWFQDRLPHRIP